jgi:hypothetical protein
MSKNKLQKYNVSGRKFKGRLEQKWETNFREKGLPYWKDKAKKNEEAGRPKINVDELDFTPDFTFVIDRLIRNFDVTAIDATNNRTPIVIHDDKGDTKDHLLGIELYRFDEEEIEYLENEDPRLIIEYMIDSGIINEPYKKRDPHEERKRLKRRIANITTILNREGLSYQDKIYLRQKKEEIENEISGLKNEDQKTKRPRTKIAQQGYVAAAARAWVVLGDRIRAGLLPKSATRADKLEILKTDKDFQKYIAPLKCGDKYLIRKLNEAKPGLWQLGGTDNKKFRRESM